MNNQRHIPEMFLIDFCFPSCKAKRGENKNENENENENEKVI